MVNERRTNIAAVVLAAGLSTRMGKPKMLLPWGNKPIIKHVIETLLSAGLNDILVVTGGYKELIDPILMTLPVKNVYNPDFANGEMLLSFQTGLRKLPASIDATFMVLGDQPTITPDLITELIEGISKNRPEIIIPSFKFRRGHPWIIHRSFWRQINQLTPPETMRTFLQENDRSIRYVEVNMPEILQDLDTPQDYEQSRPK